MIPFLKGCYCQEQKGGGVYYCEGAGQGGEFITDRGEGGADIVREGGIR